MTIVFKSREKPEKSIGWLLIFMLVPYVGIILYFFVGRNWKSKNLKEFVPIQILDSKITTRKIEKRYEYLVKIKFVMSNANINLR